MFAFEVSTDPVRDYLQSIGRTRLLVQADERELAISIEVGVFAAQRLQRDGSDLGPFDRRDLMYLVAAGSRAFDRFVESNLRLVVSIAKRYSGRGLPLMDLIQEGNLGLVRAVEKFDYQTGNKFSTYATWWIRQSILRGIADSARIIRIPVHTVEKIDKLDRIRRDLSADLGHPPTTEQLAEATGLTIDEISHLAASDAKMVSLANPMGEDGSGELGDFIEDDLSPNPHEMAVIAFRHSDIERRISALPERDAMVVRLRFGLDGRKALTLDEVGLKFGITKERVRQLEARSLTKLRSPELREYLHVES
jgi:RNA polymerase primary sigma factor